MGGYRITERVQAKRKSTSDGDTISSLITSYYCLIPYLIQSPDAKEEIIAIEIINDLTWQTFLSIDDLPLL